MSPGSSSPTRTAPAGEREAKSARRRGVTMADVARAAELSPTTVSLVLSGHPSSSRISDATAARVRAAAAELNYAPNEHARSLRRQQSPDVGVLLPHFLNDWAHHIMLGVERVLDDAGLSPLIVNHRQTSERTRRALDSFVRRRVTGVLCTPREEDIEPYRAAADAGVPVAFISDVPEGMPEASFSAWDPAAAAEAVRHLVEIGRRRIMFLAQHDDRHVTRERYDAVFGVLREAGRPVDASTRVLRDDEPSMMAAAREIFTGDGPQPDAVFCLGDDQAMRVIDLLVSLGRRVPDDVAVAATGTGLDAGFRAYGLTIMQAPVVEEGAAAARVLLRRVAEPGADPIRAYVPGGRLIVGRTTAGDRVSYRDTIAPAVGPALPGREAARAGSREIGPTTGKDLR